jgi:hypothetical protein
MFIVGGNLILKTGFFLDLILHYLCSARSLRSNHVPHLRCGRLYFDNNNKVTWWPTMQLL